MSVHYQSNCDWRMTGRRKRLSSAEIPEHVETWIGRQDQLETFLAGKLVGTVSDTTGFITHLEVDDQVPKSTVDITVLYPPDFNDVQLSPSRAMKVASKSANVSDISLPASLLPPGVSDTSSVQATRTISFYAPEYRMRYFLPGMPDGPRFTEVKGVKRAPQVITSRIVVRFGGGEVTFGGGSAPAALVSALFMPLVWKVVSDGGVPIKGTPWFECEDTLTLEYAGDG